MTQTTPDHPTPDWEGFGKAVMSVWPTGDLDGFDLQDLAEQFQIILPAPGGFDPTTHTDTFSVGAEPGDDWFERNY